MSPQETDYFLDLPALRGVAYQHEEHLELILSMAMEPKLHTLPLWTCCGVADLEIEDRRLEDINVAGVLGETIYGDMLVEFTVGSSLDSPFRRVRVEFVFFRMEGMLRFRCYDVTEVDG